MTGESTEYTGLTYANAGVDIDAGEQAAELIRGHMRRTYGPRVMGPQGGFAGMFRLDYNEKIFRRNYRDPVLVACTDGVGTKVKIAAQMGIYDTIGQDCVAMNVNDMIVQGGEPLLFLDYIGIHEVAPEQTALLVKGVADGCEQAGCTLLGGETAEMPDVYAPGDFDLAGFAVGVVELKRAIDPQRVKKGDVILGLASSGVHSNGFTLLRAIVDQAGLDYEQIYPELASDQTLGELLLEPTRIYAQQICQVLRAYRVKKPIGAMAHITGGGLPGNVSRVLPANLNAKIETKSWTVPGLFGFFQHHGDIDTNEMWRVFNMGIGYVLIVRPHFAETIRDRLQRLGEQVHPLGRIVSGAGKVILA